MDTGMEEPEVEGGTVGKSKEERMLNFLNT